MGGLHQFASFHFGSLHFAQQGYGLQPRGKGRVQEVRPLLDLGWIETTYREPKRAPAILPPPKRRKRNPDGFPSAPVPIVPAPAVPLPEVEALADIVFGPRLPLPEIGSRAPTEKNIHSILDIPLADPVISKPFTARVRSPGVMPARAREMATHVAKCRGRAFLGVRRQQVTVRRRERFSG